MVMMRLKFLLNLKEVSEPGMSARLACLASRVRQERMLRLLCLPSNVPSDFLHEADAARYERPGLPRIAGPIDRQ